MVTADCCVGNSIQVRLYRSAHRPHGRGTSHAAQTARDARGTATGPVEQMFRATTNIKHRTWHHGVSE